MAKRREIAADIRAQYGNLLNTSQAARYLGQDRRTTRIFLRGLDVYKTGKERCYLATDIARRLDECRVTGMEE